jgi:flagellar motility protein MotE (MotC chaperone)
MRLPRHFRLIPMMMIVAGMAFVVRVGDFVSTLDNMGSAQAQEEVKSAPPPMTADHTDTATAPKTTEQVAIPDKAKATGAPVLPDPMAKADAQKADTKEQAAEKPNLAAGPDMKAGKPVQWKDAADSDVEDSDSRNKLYQDLGKRRDALDKREKEIGVREALLSAAERELDQKTRELTALKTEIQAATKKRSDEEDARIGSLVKIYEGMKPKDAASIFNTLDLDVLMVIMTKMNERKSSPILALMNTERAKTVTTMMAEQKKQPELPPASN